MLTCVSGLPGHGKTLYTLCQVEKLRLESGRPVFYWGIEELKLPWVHLDDPKNWMQLPSGAILVIDECYKIFEKRPPGSKPPPFVQDMATHRHKGLDIFLIAQKPKDQVDFFVRGLIGRHHHVRRLFGSEKARVSSWERLADPDEWHDRQEAVQSFFNYPKESFGWYKSAEVHTVKRTLPWKNFAMIGGGVLAIPLLFYLAYRLILPTSSSKPSAVATSSPSSPAVLSSPGRPGGVLTDPKSYVPAIAGIPYTTPAFASAVRIAEAPVVAGCGVLKVGRGTTCKCTDQQGNTLKLEHRVCLDYFANGAFNPLGSARYPSIPAYVPSLPGPASGGPGERSSGAAPSISHENSHSDNSGPVKPLTGS